MWNLWTWNGLQSGKFRVTIPKGHRSSRCCCWLYFIITIVLVVTENDNKVDESEDKVEDRDNNGEEEDINDDTEDEDMDYENEITVEDEDGHGDNNKNSLTEKKILWDLQKYLQKNVKPTLTI